MNENWYKLIETNKKDDKVLEFIKKEFDKRNIIYKIELEEKWEGLKVPKYIGTFVVYVKKEFIDKAEELVGNYYEENTVTEKYIEAYKNDNTEEESKRISKKQEILGKILIGIVVAMVLSIIIAGTFA